MDELRPGLWHWKTEHPNIGAEVSSYFHAPSGTLIDPFAPDDEAPMSEHPPQRIVMTNRHHVRDVAELASRYGVPILCHVDGLHEFEDSGAPDVQGYDIGDHFQPGITVLPNCAITPEEVTLWIEAGPGAMHFADGITNSGGELGFFPDSLLGDDPEAVKRRIRGAAMNVLDHDFDDLLFAHGDPILGGGHAKLTEFARAG
ncbi:hypothetical protein HJD18_00610 [Thermoleophilia bacterium SCSIO 60948]|nr:hypothetical protein HJD18_00610 [Thermoleophilia bacterium SCSIO 60948]